MANKRVFYACQAAVIASPNDLDDPAKLNPTVTAGLTGLQSVGITTNFNLEQVFELGQISIYENIEGVPDVEVTLERVLDGSANLAYKLATQAAAANTLVARSKERCKIGLGIYDDAIDNVAAQGNAPFEVTMEGLYVSNVSYTFNTDGNFTESISFVGNSKKYKVGSDLVTAANVAELNGTDTPDNLLLGGVQRRENLNWAGSILPLDLPNIGNAGFGNNLLNGKPIEHVNSITISTDFGRDDIFELGRKAPYYRAPNFPIEVTCDIEVTATNADGIQAFEEGDPAFDGTVNAGNNTRENKIVFATEDGNVFDLGIKNRLSSVTYGGGDTSGGQATITYSFTNFNDLTVT